MEELSEGADRDRSVLASISEKVGVSVRYVTWSLVTLVTFRWLLPHLQLHRHGQPPRLVCLDDDNDEKEEEEGERIVSLVQRQHLQYRKKRKFRTKKFAY